MDFSFTAQLRLRKNGTSPWSRHFITIPKDISDQIKEIASSVPRKGRWSVRVEVRVGFLTRETSIFPDKKSNSYLLAIKADIRKQLHIKAEDTIHVNVQII